jgi:hypothetical protein
MEWSCKNQASTMSCAAMLSLVKKEYEKQSMSLSYQVLHPNCDQLSLLVDNSKQYKRGAISRNICFTHDPALKAGPYFSQIGDDAKDSFEKWTRQKTISKAYKFETVIHDLDSVYTSCYNTIPADLQCRLDGTVCPAKCDIHPMQCPNPIR